MQVAAIKATPNRKITDNKQLEIQNYDTHNDYPQKVLDLAGGSGTIRSCLKIYTRFLIGKGIDKAAGNLVIGSEKLRNVIRKATQDYARFGGFALHCSYNAFGRISRIEHVPFEFCRLGIEDKEGHVTKIAVNRDWLGTKKSPSKSNTIYCNVFNPDKALEEIEAAGGIEQYNGQILYANPDGEGIYPSCLYEAQLTDGGTQIACANIRYRNARNGFMPFGMIVLRKTKEYDSDVDGSPDGRVDRPDIDRGLLQNPMLQDIAKLQGDVNTSKMLVFELEPDDQPPEFHSLDGKNYDGAFKETETSTKANIGEAFMQPPILRCEQVANGFADDMMEQAYKFYNSITEDDRAFIEETFSDVFAHWWRPFSAESLRITPLSYLNATHNTAE